MSSILLILFIVVPVALAVLFAALGKHGAGQDNRFLNSFAVAQAAIYLALSLWTAFGAALPLSSGGGYFFIDDLAAFEIGITSLVFLLAAVYARGYVASLVRAGEIDRGILRLFYGSFCLLELVTVLAFASGNLALLWIFAELSTFFSSVLIVTLRATENIIAALKYVFVASTAMLFSLIGIIILYALSRTAIGNGSLNWNELLSVASRMDGKLFLLAFVFLFLGFAAKAGVAPFHTWVPTAYVRAPSAVAVVSGTVLNLGIYAILRLYAIGNAAGDATQLRVLLFVFGLFSIGVAAFSMLKRTNTKKVIAFSGVESAGLLLVAVGLGTSMSVYWALFYTLGYSLVKSLLFFCAGIFHRQYLSNKYFAIKSSFKLQPLASWGLIAGSAAAVGLPAFPMFLGKWNILSQAADLSPWLLVTTLLLLLPVAIGMAYFFIRAFTQPGESDAPAFHTPWSMRLPIIAALILLVVLGLWVPGGLNELLNRIVSSLGL
jgi:hydrogenase-4 component F